MPSDLIGVYSSPFLSVVQKKERLKEGWDFDIGLETAEDMSMFEGAGQALWDQAKEKGKSEGKLLNAAENVKSLSLSLGIPYRKAMEYLKIPPAEQEEILPLLEKQDK